MAMIDEVMYDRSRSKELSWYRRLFLETNERANLDNREPFRCCCGWGGEEEEEDGGGGEEASIAATSICRCVTDRGVCVWVCVVGWGGRGDARLSASSRAGLPA